MIILNSLNFIQILVQKIKTWRSSFITQKELDGTSSAGSGRSAIRQIASGNPPGPSPPALRSLIGIDFGIFVCAWRLDLGFLIIVWAKSASAARVLRWEFGILFCGLLCKNELCLLLETSLSASGRLLLSILTISPVLMGSMGKSRCIILPF